MNTITDMNDALDFGALAPEVNQLLQRGVAAHFSDPAAAEADFLAALAIAPEALPAHRCLVKHYNRHRRFDDALAAANAWLAEATRQAGLPADWRDWSAAPGAAVGSAVGALKGLAFVHLRRGETAATAAMIAQVERLDPTDAVGGSVVAALLADVVGATD